MMMNSMVRNEEFQRVAHQGAEYIVSSFHAHIIMRDAYQMQISMDGRPLERIIFKVDRIAEQGSMSILKAAMIG